jgi:hypothetical protein
MAFCFYEFLYNRVNTKRHIRPDSRSPPKFEPATCRTRLTPTTSLQILVLTTVYRVTKWSVRNALSSNLKLSEPEQFQCDYNTIHFKANFLVEFRLLTSYPAIERWASPSWLYVSSVVILFCHLSLTCVIEYFLCQSWVSIYSKQT